MEKFIGPGTPWKTEAAFWTWLRGGLRRAVWMRHPIKLELLKGARYKAPIGRGGKEVWAVVCALCNKEVRQSDSQVDHLTPAGSLNKAEDIQGFIERLALVTKDDLQIVCKACHSVLSYSQRYGVSIAEAKKRKTEIARKKNGTRKARKRTT